jgi:hypothetical protein
MSDAKNPESLARRNWLDHEYTRVLSRDVDKRLSSELATLLNVCSESTDPRVLRAYAAFNHVRQLQELVGKPEKAK